MEPVSDVVEDDSELHRLGLLYDDEHSRGSGFNLDSVVHSEPTYIVRPTKRARRSRAVCQDHLELLSLLSFPSVL